jgi:methionyl-tRNA synthetase
MGLPLPKTVFAHGWWLIADQKMSKSVGNVVNPMDMADKYGVDALRYFLMAAMSLGQDANFSEESFVTRYNADLANNLGNLLSRMCTMVVKNFDGKLPAACEPTADETEMIDACHKASASWENAIRNMQLDRGIADIMGAVAATNRYFDAMKPWAMAKSGDIASLGRVLRNTAEALRVTSGLLYPVMPTKMAELRKAIGIADDKIVPSMSTLALWNQLEDGTAVTTIPGSLFPRIKLEEPKA